MPRSFPATRLRRNRQTDFIRRLVRETELTVNDLIYPVFVVEGADRQIAVDSMPGINRLSVDNLLKHAEEAANRGIPAIALFPYTQPDLRTPDGSEAWNPDGLIPRAVAALKEALPELGVMTKL